MPGPTITVNSTRHSLAATTDPAGLGLPLAVARDLHGATAARAPEVAAATPRPAARRKPRARVRG